MDQARKDEVDRRFGRAAQRGEGVAVKAGALAGIGLARLARRRAQDAP